MKILFCKAPWMAYYKGNCNEDCIENNSSDIVGCKETYGQFNFYPVKRVGLNYNIQDTCFGFVEPTSKIGRYDILNIERLEGLYGNKANAYIEDVLVIWCATKQSQETRIVGWYKHATVYKAVREEDVNMYDGCYERPFNIFARAEDCVLLPLEEREKPCWQIANKCMADFEKTGVAYAWDVDIEYLNVIVRGINSYGGDNNRDKFPENKAGIEESLSHYHRKHYRQGEKEYTRIINLVKVFWGIMFVISGIDFAKTEDILGGCLIAALGISILPIYNFLGDKLHIKFNKSIAWKCPLVIFGIWVLIETLMNWQNA